MWFITSSPFFILYYISITRSTCSLFICYVCALTYRRMYRRRSYVLSSLFGPNDGSARVCAHSASAYVNIACVPCMLRSHSHRRVAVWVPENRYVYTVRSPSKRINSAFKISIQFWITIGVCSNFTTYSVSVGNSLKILLFFVGRPSFKLNILPEIIMRTKCIIQRVARWFDCLRSQHPKYMIGQDDRRLNIE